jgi:hypothetical protein
MDPQLSRFLTLLKDNGGRLLVEDLMDQVRDLSVVERAEQLGLVSFNPEGGPLGYRDTYDLTRKGWRALGLEPPPTILQKLRSLFRKAA